MKKVLFEVNSLNDLPMAASRILDFAAKDKIFAFYGSMGAGKTTLINEICNQLGVEGETSSPTFSIVNEYTDKNGETIYHFDFYRIKKLEEVYDIGFEEYIYSDSMIFMEWPELIEPLMPEEYIAVRINEKPNQSREIELEIIVK